MCVSWNHPRNSAARWPGGPDTPYDMAAYNASGAEPTRVKEGASDETGAGPGTARSAASWPGGPDTPYDMDAFNARRAKATEADNSANNISADIRAENSADSSASMVRRPQFRRVLLVQHDGMAALPGGNENAKSWLRSGGSVELLPRSNRDSYMPFWVDDRPLNLNMGDEVFCEMRARGTQRRFCARKITWIDWSVWGTTEDPCFITADGWCYRRDIYGLRCPQFMPEGRSAGRAMCT